MMSRMKNLLIAQILGAVLVAIGAAIYLSGATGWGFGLAVAGALLFMVATILSGMKSGEP
jgi:hypothetical protein